MARHYVIQDWSSAAEYSGEMIGSRLSASQEHHFNRDGSANTSLYAEPEKQTKVKPITKQSLVESIIPQEKRYANLEAKLTQLENNKHLMTFEEYSELRVLLERKLSRQWQLIEKARGWNEEKPTQNNTLPSQILSENNRSALKRKQSKGACVKARLKTENVKHDRKSLSKVAEFLAKNDWATFTLGSIIVFIGTQIIF
ncbi:MAG: hypothetical protein [Caudoviricetes sp.]|nr:MAG: hypothetical protein [Caudoviricetes sp.]